MAEDLKNSRRARKAALTRAIHDTQRHVVEEEVDEVKDGLKTMREKFKNFAEKHDEYLETLNEENEINACEDDYYQAEKAYMSAVKEIKDWIKSGSVKREMQELSTEDSESSEMKEIGPIAAPVTMESLCKVVNFPSATLDEFDGDPMQYHAFFALFDETVANVVTDDAVKLNRLYKYTKGDAKDAIKRCPTLGGTKGYKLAREILHRRFGNDHLIAEQIISGLKSGQPIKSCADLRKLSDELLNCYATLSEMSRIQEIDTQSCIADIASRLQPYIRTRWKRLAMDMRRDKDRYPNFQDFVDFVAREADDASDPVYGKWNLSSKSGYDPNNSRSSSDPKAKKSVTSLSTDIGPTSQKKLSCILCQRDHRLFWCPQFKSMKPVERRKFVRDNKLCENCLLANHTTANCRKPSVCSVPGCGRKHTKFIHVETNRSEDSNDGHVVSNQVDIESDVRRDSLDVCLPIVPVKVNDKCVVFALLDSGSTNTFCSQNLVDQLKIKGTVVNYTLNTLGQSNDRKSTEVVSLNLSSRDGHEKRRVHSVFVIDKIPFSNVSFDAKMYSHIKDLPLPRNVQVVDILIGQDHADLLLPLDVRKGNKGDPFATRTVLGWSLNGPVLSSDRVNKHIVSNFVNAKHDIEDQVRDLWKIENESHCGDVTAWSKNDEKVIDLWNSEIKVENDHYTLPIPWKDDVIVPNNVKVARSRLKSLLASLRRRDLFESYDLEIQKLLDKGYAEKVQNESSGDKIWYLPHQAVISENKPGKMRVVFDCASKFDGQSLNDKCHQGPDLNNKLLNVLLRFRQHQYAFSADVEAMYYQVCVPEEDRDALRFLWVDSGGNVVHYRMTRHVFGGIWCACAATYAMRKTIDDLVGFDPLVTETILKSFYVDDCLRSLPSREQVHTVIQGTMELLKGRGFRLTKFVGNDDCVYDHVPDEDVAPSVKNALPDVGSKALGVRWDVDADEFHFEFKLPELEIVTRRIILSLVSSTFDPLGFLSPVLIGGRIIFQGVTRLKLSWDDLVPDDIRVTWQKWLRSIADLSVVRIPRCIKPSQFDDCYVELHHFSDASEQAYGSCTYLRCIDKSGEIHVSLVFSKGKVAPLKTVSIPRLELMGAVLSAHSDSMLRDELELDIAKSYFWVDSTIVLQYINSVTRRFQVFVANRVGTIRSLTDPADWHHVPGKDNPADLITRGCGPADLSRQRWFDGPSFLHDYKSAWKFESHIGEVSVNDPEVKSDISGDPVVVVNCLTHVNEHPIDKLFAHHSSLNRLKRSICWLLSIKAKLCHGKVFEDHISVAELRNAENIIVKHVQGHYFGKELTSLHSGNEIERSSSIRDLCPFVDANGILCVGGRLQYSDLDGRTKHPYIIPHQHKLSVLIAREFHEVAHLGPEWTLSRIRGKFWITKGRIVVKSVCKNCVTCRKLYAPPGVQKMANLPPERLEPNKPPFTYVGVDCFGPYHVKYGRSEIKRYGCLYTCLTTRAIHIEKLVSMDTDAFLNGFRRFVSRRGVPVKVWSDNGTNFQGGYTELKKSMKQLNSDKILHECVQKNVEWVFNPPNASHMGGIWERLIRVVRKVFASILKGSRLTDDLLDTLFCEAEAIVNSRPITKLSDDVNDVAALTPNHLLLLHGGPPPPPGLFKHTEMYRCKWKYVQFLACQFWKRWIKEYIPQLQQRQKWLKNERNLKKGDVVLLVDENTPRSLWPLGLIRSVKLSRDGLVRSAEVKTRSSVLVRPVTKIVLLEGCE